MKNDRWIYSYDYPPDSIWENWRLSDGVPSWIMDEAEAVSERVRENKIRWRALEESKKLGMGNQPVGDMREMLCFLLLTDSHCTYNGTWDDTVESMRAVANSLSGRGIRMDRIIHLGDLTDGLLPLNKTEEIEQQCILDMQEVLMGTGALDEMEGIRDLLNIVPGNHDYNYFRGNPEIRYPSTPQYYIDEPGQKLRLIFMDSFDPKEKLRYGFTEYCIHWVESVLHMMPKDYVAIIFSHVPPIKQLHAWSDWIRNSHILMPVLDKFADRILAYINGHSHCDHLFNDLHNGQFPIISINCAKCEYFLEHKPEGAVVPYRRLGARMQESFDIMQVDTEKREIYFTRFGAGQDRIVRNHKAEWV